MGTRWTCPYCGHAQIDSSESSNTFRTVFYIGKNVLGRTAIRGLARSCLNSDCGQFSLDLQLVKLHPSNADIEVGVIRSWQLLPESKAKVQPDYIPLPLRQDYLEACRIVSLSPKASATLARRCLQGMIRDFCGIARKRLVDEIGELGKHVAMGKAPTGVTPESVQGIDDVRSIGNIGAHMEADIDAIVDVDEGEADVLISLVEMLFEEWYVAQHQRQQQFTKLATIAAEKKAQIAEAKARAAGADQSQPFGQADEVEPPGSTTDAADSTE